MFNTLPEDTSFHNVAIFLYFVKCLLLNMNAKTPPFFSFSDHAQTHTRMHTHTGLSRAGPWGQSHLKEWLPNEGENLFYGGAAAVKADCIDITHAPIKDVIDINKETSACPILRIQLNCMTTLASPSEAVCLGVWSCCFFCHRLNSKSRVNFNFGCPHAGPIPTFFFKLEAQWPLT